MTKAFVVRGGEEGRHRRDHGDGGETEIAFAAIGVFEFLHDAGGGADGGPANAVFASDDKGPADVFCAAENACKQIGLGRTVIGVLHGGTDGDDEFVAIGDGIELQEEGDGFCGRKALGVFGKRLSGEADGLDLVAAGFEGGAGALEQGESISNLLLVLDAIEIHEGGDGADAGLGLLSWSLLLSRSGGEGCECERQQDRGIAKMRAEIHVYLLRMCPRNRRRALSSKLTRFGGKWRGCLRRRKGTRRQKPAERFFGRRTPPE